MKLNRKGSITEIVALFASMQYGQSFMRIRVLLLTFVAIMCGLVSPAYAYLDPGTGSIILQGIIGSIAAGVAIIGIYWQKVKAFFSSENASSESASPENVSSVEQQKED
jgi:hypothetical protein